jgi:hypothetical protein
MTRILAACAAVALTAAFAMPVPASADTSKRSDGVRNMTDQTDVSSRHRHRRHVHRYYAPRYGYYRGPRYGYARPYYHDAPYYAYAPRYRYHRPYYGPGVGVGVGPFGFGFGFR